MSPFIVGCLGMLVLILTICARIPIGVGMVLVGTAGLPCCPDWNRPWA